MSKIDKSEMQGVGSRSVEPLLSFKQADPSFYKAIGFTCGLEVHQQLDTKEKLFCHCPARRYQKPDEFDGEILRHMRPTLSELGEYDGTALMEFKTRKEIVYRLQNSSACTYEMDDTPPFTLNREALQKAISLAKQFKTSLVDELHITRKQYLDGSIPAGFQRTGIVGVEGEITLPHKNIRIIQISLEEDSCRQIADRGHTRIFTTDRLGIPLIEVVTYPDMKTPQEAELAGQYIRYICRSSNKVRSGIGAARQDVNVSIVGGTRVEIKGVAHLRWIPELAHNEAVRQVVLLRLRDELGKRIHNPKRWGIRHQAVTDHLMIQAIRDKYGHIVKQAAFIGLVLPRFKGLLAEATQPGKSFANEIEERLQVIACLEGHCMIHSDVNDPIFSTLFSHVAKMLKAKKQDAMILFWAPKDDVETALETIEERCRLAFEGVPKETRKSLPGKITVFERVLPGPDRMYPDTDSAPIPIDHENADDFEDSLPSEPYKQISQLKVWQIPKDLHHHILRHNLFTHINRLYTDYNFPPTMGAKLLGQTLKHAIRCFGPSPDFSLERIYELVQFVIDQKLDLAILKPMLYLVYKNPQDEFSDILKKLHFKKVSLNKIRSKISQLCDDFKKVRRSKEIEAKKRWIMGQLRPLAIGNISLAQLSTLVERGGADA